MHDKSHLKLFSSDKQDKEAVKAFNEALAEAMIDYDFAKDIYGNTDSDDSEFFKYILFQDNIYDMIIKLKHRDFGRAINYGQYKYCMDSDYDACDQEIKKYICGIIHDLFPYNEDLVKCTTDDKELPEFFTNVIDCLEHFKC